MLGVILLTVSLLSVIMLNVVVPHRLHNIWQQIEAWISIKSLLWALCVLLCGPTQGILKGEVSLYHWPPVWLVWNQPYDSCFYLQNRLIQTSQTGGERTVILSPFSFPWPTLSDEDFLDVISLFQWYRLLHSSSHIIAKRRRLAEIKIGG